MRRGLAPVAAPPDPPALAEGGGGAGAPILDIPTPDCGMIIKTGLNGRSRRIFSRSLLGVKKPGRYYFLTMTTTPQNPLKKQHWDAVRKKLKEILPRTVHLHVATSEGNGVLHIILRLGKGEKRLEIKPFRSWWYNYTGAKQIKILRVGKKRDLARYIADQRYKKDIAGEFAWQDMIVSWGYSKGWLPKTFGKHFGRFWYKSRDAGMGQREMFLHDWLMRCYDSPDEVLSPPMVRVLGNDSDQEVVSPG